MDDKNVINLLEEKQKELKKWKEELKSSLDLFQKKNETFFLVSKYWLDKYEKLDEKQLKDPNIEKKIFRYADYNNELLSIFAKKKINIDDLPVVFALSKNIWTILECQNEINAVISPGFFGNKILIVKVLESTYCLIFFGKKHLKQGYLQVLNKDKENDIVTNFYQKGFHEKNLNINHPDYKIKLFNSS